MPASQPGAFSPHRMRIGLTLNVAKCALKGVINHFPVTGKGSADSRCSRFQVTVHAVERATSRVNRPSCRRSRLGPRCWIASVMGWRTLLVPRSRATVTKPAIPHIFIECSLSTKTSCNA
jgi:hypothetical protein